MGRGDVQAHQRLAGAGYAGDEDDDLLALCAGALDQRFHAPGGIGEIPLVGLGAHDVRHAVVGVEVTGRLDDGGRGLVTAGDPRGGIQRSGVLGGECIEQLRQQVRADGDGRGHAVGGQAHRWQRIGVVRGGDEHRHDGQRMAGFVEVLGVQRVFPRLVARLGARRAFVDLELQHQHAATHQQHGIHAQAHARDVEFQQQVAGAAGEVLLQQRDGFEPGIALQGLDGERAVAGEVADDFFGGLGEEVGEGRGVPGAGQAGAWGGWRPCRMPGYRLSTGMHRFSRRGLPAGCAFGHNPPQTQ